MAYLPAQTIQLVDLAETGDVAKPALFTADRSDTKMLLVGRHAIFLTGDYAGQAFAPTEEGVWYGTLMEGVSLELDPDSVVFSDPPPLAMHRAVKSIYLRAGTQGRGTFGQSARIDVLTELPAAPVGQVASFTRWRLVAEVRGEAVSLFEFDAAPSAT